MDRDATPEQQARGVTQPGNRNGAIITAIVSLAEALGLDTTAEGIETLDELAMVADLRVKQIQGFVYEKAISFDRVSEALARELAFVA